MVFPVFIRTHCGTGRFCLCFLARTRLIRKVLWDACQNTYDVNKLITRSDLEKLTMSIDGLKLNSRQEIEDNKSVETRFCWRQEKEEASGGGVQIAEREKVEAGRWCAGWCDFHLFPIFIVRPAPKFEPRIADSQIVCHPTNLARHHEWT